MKTIRQHLLVLLSIFPAISLADGELCEPARPAPGLADRQSWPTLPEDAIEITADQARVERDGHGLVSGNVRLRQNDIALLADQAEFDAARQRFSLSGNVVLVSPDLELHGKDARLSSRDQTLSFTGSEFVLPNGAGRGAASRLDTPGEGQIRMEDVSFTTCPVGDDDWLLEASEIRLDRERGSGHARHARLRLKGVPILYAPAFSFPLSNARKSGLLPPRVGQSSRAGTEIEVPLYVNLAPNYDFTFSPTWMSKRGVLYKEEFRYLSPLSNGAMELEYLPNDQVAGDDRILGRVRHQTRWSSGWWASVNAANVSDSHYFEDLGGSQSLSSQTQLERSLQLEYNGPNWSMLARIQDFQTLDDRIEDAQRPYKRMPQLLASGYWPDTVGGAAFRLDTELVHFDRNVGITGTRVNLTPELSLPLGQPSRYLTPTLAWEFTSYSLEGAAPGADTSPSRNTPIFSLDSGLMLERMTAGDRPLISTLEPRIQYVYIPYNNQDALPVFDTGEPDFNLVQLFRRDRFAGPDRVGDTNHLAMGLTARLIDPDNGRQYLAATVGGQYYFKEQRVGFERGGASGGSSSDLFAELNYGFFNRWNLAFGHQWEPEDKITRKTHVRVQYKPSDNRVVNLAYRFNRDTLEQTDLSLSWPVAQGWNAVGRWNYSLKDKSTLDNFVGLQYENCCWGISLVSRRYIAARTGERDSSIMLQLSFKGLSNVGSRVDKMLARGILGYE